MITDYQIIIRLLLATVLGGLIGFEREKHGRSAGFRTHILVGLGSTLIMMTSIYVFDIYRGVAAADPGRIAAQVVTGMGFLGAGTILRSKTTVTGLTTAASLWAIAGIGLAIGSGFYSAAIITAVLVFVTLEVFSKVEKALALKGPKKKGGENDREEG